MSARMPFPLPVEFGRRDDGTVWVTFGPLGGDHVAIHWPGSLRQASDFAQMVNAVPKAAEALKAVRADARDIETDTALASATHEQIDEALAAMGVRP